MSALCHYYLGLYPKGLCASALAELKLHRNLMIEHHNHYHNFIVFYNKVPGVNLEDANIRLRTFKFLFQPVHPTIGSRLENNELVFKKEIEHSSTE
eukprot:Pgem_evm1s14460